jgi:hypothetical protein
VGIQRALSKTTAIEVRYVHTTSTGTWRSYNYNELNIVENGFLEEFRKAQANLVLSGGKSFAYTGAAGSQQLPILLGWLSGKPASQAGSTSAYTGTGWTSSSYITNLALYNPDPFAMASSIRANSNYKKNAATAQIPANFFVANPDVSGAYMTANGGDTRYNGVQAILTRRFAQGLQVSANYSFGRAYQQDFYSFHKPLVWREQSYDNRVGNARGNINHVFAANWVYELPFGQGKAFGGGVGRNLNRLIGNWSYTGIVRLQSGRPLDLGGVRLVGMTPDDVRKMMKLRFTTDPSNQFRTIVYDWPQDVIDNTMKAYNVTYNGYANGAPTGRYFAPANGPDCIETATGYGDCGVRSLIVTGPMAARVDMSLLKDIMVTNRVSLQFQVQIFNVLNRVNFLPVSGIGSTTIDGFAVTGSSDDARTGQLAFRISW